MPKAIIISLGGTPEPVITAIDTHKPEAVCFFASDQSVDLVGGIKAELKDRGVAFSDTKVLCDDINDLVHCYERALACAGKLSGLLPDLDPEQVVVDYTGGTKTMTAALALATVGKGFRFSYVGGAQRTKEGTGIVVSGTEIVKSDVSPWQLFAVEEKQRIALYFNRCQFAAALDAIAHLPGALPDRERRLFDCLKSIIEGYAAWDRFDHAAAIAKLGQGYQALRVFCDAVSEPGLIRFCEDVQANMAFLQSVNAKQPGMALATDLLSNARRRAEEGKYDDAVARLYRTLELIGQIAFRETMGCETGKVPPGKIPESLREAYKSRYLNETSGLLKLGAHATFHALHAIEHPAGQAYFNAEQDFDSLLQTRNDSILAHGNVPVKQSTFDRLDGLIRVSFEITDKVKFPTLVW